MNINRLRWLSERIVNSEKKEFEEFIDTYDKDIVSFVVEACYEKKPADPTKLFITLKNAITKRENELSSRKEEYTSVDNSYFARALYKFDNVIVARIDKDEEISEQLRVIAIKENIKLASVQALGAINDFTVGVYKTDEKKYYSNSFQGYYEITSLTGTINTMDGEYYAHLHMSAGNQKGEVFGGHLNRAIVSATCELVITVIDGRVDRVHDEETGLNIFKFN